MNCEEADLWTQSDHKVFDARVKKIADYFSAFKPLKDGEAYSGKLVSAEATADLGSMTCMMRIAKKTEGFDYDAFFRSFAYFFSIVQTVENNEYRAHTDTHPLPNIRTNVLLSQYDEFLETYGIKPGDKMYVAPEDRIGVWGMGDGTTALLGDADCDGEVTILDATAIQRTLASLPVASFNETAADVDGDGEVTILDATAIQRCLAGLPCPDGIGKPIR